MYIDPGSGPPALSDFPVVYSMVTRGDEEEPAWAGLRGAYRGVIIGWWWFLVVMVEEKPVDSASAISTMGCPQPSGQKKSEISWVDLMIS